MTKITNAIRDSSTLDLARLEDRLASERVLPGPIQHALRQEVVAVLEERNAADPYSDLLSEEREFLVEILEGANEGGPTVTRDTLRFVPVDHTARIVEDLIGSPALSERGNRAAAGILEKLDR